MWILEQVFSRDFFSYSLKHEKSLPNPQLAHIKSRIIIVTLYDFP